MTEFALDDGLRARIRRGLDGLAVQRIGKAGLRSAAVMLAITTNPAGEAALILTRRPQRMGRHPGQYALPGGKIDAGESASRAALRETEEELGLALPSSAILGRLDDYATRSGFVIAPFVAWAGPRVSLDPSPHEVAAVHLIPFAELDSPAIPLLDPGEDPERPVLYSRFPSLGTRMAAPTAAIIYQFREVAIRGLQTRVAHFDQPRFAWQ